MEGVSFSIVMPEDLGSIDMEGVSLGMPIFGVLSSIDIPETFFSIGVADFLAVVEFDIIAPLAMPVVAAAAAAAAASAFWLCFIFISVSVAASSSWRFCFSISIAISSCLFCSALDFIFCSSMAIFLFSSSASFMRFSSSAFIFCSSAILTCFSSASFIFFSSCSIFLLCISILSCFSFIMSLVVWVSIPIDFSAEAFSLSSSSFSTNSPLEFLNLVKAPILSFDGIAGPGPAMIAVCSLAKALVEAGSVSIGIVLNWPGTLT